MSYTPWRSRTAASWRRLPPASQRERGRLERGRYKELYRRFRKQYLLPSQLIQQAINQGVETGKSFLALKRNGRIRKPHPEVGRVSIRFAKDS